MRTMELEVYSDETNYAIVRAPGRSFPGCLIQGDSLSILHRDAFDISRRLKELAITDETLLSAAASLQENLAERLMHYQAVLAAHGLTLPYTRPVTPADVIKLFPEDGETE